MAKIDKPIRIILAEDFDILREDLIETLEGQDDFTVVGEAANGKEIIAIALDRDFDICLLDIEMDTVRDGITAAEAILKAKPDSTIIFLTAHETDSFILPSMAVGSVGYFIKGSPDADLFAYIRAAYHGETIILPEIQQVVLKEYSRLHKSERSLLYFINKVSKLTEVEIELLRLLLQGKSNREIAQIRFVELTTVKSQIGGLLRKFDCNRTREIVEIIHDLNIAYLFEKERGNKHA